MATVKLVLLMSLVAVVLTFPTEKSKSRSVQKRSAPSLDKRSVFDMFDKFDLNGDSKLEFHEIAYFFFNNFHFSLEDAQHYAQQQLNNFDINKDGVLDIWEFLKDPPRSDALNSVDMYY
ncbi:uncharacterized protein LOC111121967 [Crassostrea virginica]|uniref:Uncharacterized protein LOC111121967 n=1 Tax=Crassostrea virginica TaxID=6565 RepID=A0A8B8CTN8_CRAVI|nr:uncharacterized protein LOC111121967 [Crassostrea virginica]XP_022319176.1 uncharacterized protein LOC111121967 [Crassostrea virginica]XP_022319177.1 uncharacterized protein LOC111121968 [Crassostrea virginica]XP_022319178.1 uncharacterized protein LOC111121968 [Crassostrea virginica]